MYRTVGKAVGSTRRCRFLCRGVRVLVGLRVHGSDRPFDAEGSVPRAVGRRRGCEWEGVFEILLMANQVDYMP